MIFFTSDQHFFHKNIIRYCNRPFLDVGEMNYVLVQKWNSVVQDDDLVYVLGDFAFTSPSKITALLRQLKGNKILILGNHDNTYKKNKWERMGFFRVLERENIAIGGKDIELNHYPVYDPNKWVLHGHIHTRYRIKRGIHFQARNASEFGCINVGVDVWDFTPVSMKTISDIIHGRIECDNFGTDAQPSPVPDKTTSQYNTLRESVTNDFKE